MAGEEGLMNDVTLRRNDAIAALYDRYAPSLLSLCLRYCGNLADAEDVLQEGFIRIIRYLPRFRANHEKSLAAWMKRIMVNMALNHLRDQSRGKRFLEADPFHEPLNGDDRNDDFLAELGQKISREQIMGFIGSLPAGYRTVFNLYVFEEFSHREIAKALGCSESTSKSQLSKARVMLRKRLTEYVQKEVMPYEKEQPSY
jgi:RNA polymerase sigma-70 factor (ECF subfamily)